MGMVAGEDTHSARCSRRVYLHSFATEMFLIDGLMLIESPRCCMAILLFADKSIRSWWCSVWISSLFQGLLSIQPADFFETPDDCWWNPPSFMLFFKIYVKVTCRLFAPPGVPLRSWAIAWPGEARPLGEVATGSFGEREFTTKYAKLSDPHWSIRYLGVYHYKLGWQLWGV